MDKNKLKVLRDVCYVIPKTCGICVHGCFDNDSQFGTCALRTYQHEKHTGLPRQLSIYVYGNCPAGDVRPEVLSALGPWEEY